MTATRLLPLGMFLLFLPWSAGAQVVTAALEGVVHDPSGAAVAGANVVVRNTATNAEARLTTGRDGFFLVPALPPGPSTVTVAEPGQNLIDSANFGNIRTHANLPRQLQFALKILFRLRGPGMKKCLNYWVFTICGLCLAPYSWASGPNGTDDGWAIDNGGRPLLTAERAAEIAQGGTGWVRIGMRRIPGQPGWQDEDLQRYDAPVNNAIAAGLQVFILIGEGAIPGGQTAWNENNYEHGGGSSNGQNQFIDDFVNNAVIPIVQHFHDRVKIYEIWNEPNAWTRNPAPGYYEGGTWIYPSNYSWVLAQSWVAVHAELGLDDVTLFFGGVFGHSIGGQYSYARAGAQYIDDVYNVGINAVGSFAWVQDDYGSYPLDGVGQHLYINQGGLTTTEHILQYLDWVRQAYTKYEGADSSKKVFITEMGWTTASVSQDIQDQDLRIAFAAIEQRPHVQMTIWFRWQDVVNPRLLYGVLDRSGNQKQSYAGYQFYQSYEGRFSDHSVQSDILNYYSAFGQPVLGNPYDNGGTAWVHDWGDGFVQDFNGGSNQKLAIMSSVQGTFQVNDVHGLWTFYLTHDGISVHGYPLDDEYVVCGGTRQDFEQGFMTWDPMNGIVDHANN